MLLCLQEVWKEVMALAIHCPLCSEWSNIFNVNQISNVDILFCSVVCLLLLLLLLFMINDSQNLPFELKEKVVL